MSIYTYPDNTSTLVTQNQSIIGFTDFTSSMANGEEFDSGWLDMSAVDKYQLSFYSDNTPNLTLLLSSRDDENQPAFDTPASITSSNQYLASLPPRARFMRFRLQNNSGTSVSNVSFLVRFSYGSADKASVLPLERPPQPFSGALLTQSVLIGVDSSSTYRNAGVNQIGALLTSDFGTEVARELYSGYEVNTKFGRNPSINTGSTPEDIYNGGSLYTGHNATANENISVTSSDNDDRGSLVSSGTATGGSNTSLVDSSATFVTDGVTAGDLVINDTQGIHGIVTSVDSETQVTIFEMIDGVTGDLSNSAGDTYRIATSIDSGAAVLKLKNILDEDYVRQTSVYVILNGTSTVTTTGVNAMRCDTGRIVIAGSTGRNEGEITVTQSSSTSNVFCVIPTFGSTTIGCTTVPAGKDAIVKRILCSIVRTNGSAGSATIAFNVRRFGQAFTAERVYELQTGAPVLDEIVGGLIIPPGSDIKGTVEDVSDNNTIAQITFEYYLIDRQ